ncbi:hypothetical protein [Nitrosovibrio sp. Nv17]|uniref:hypothetical protein n=1 Tax=Nitrosovibrio sp. Nv17 TaxID=1855339 RepID=UPI000908755C|nr:hypothetical protein [Nitrosovibrio sp. Nv17]SFW31484.1 hypothetical protein SAMN05216414_11541 [Nitrosovibrio sp. Nv17]
MRDLARLRQFATLVDELIFHASKEELAECARLLAVTITHYEMKYGELTMDGGLLPQSTKDFTDTHYVIVTKGMETLAGVLGNVIRGAEERARH